MYTMKHCQELEARWRNENDSMLGKVLRRFLSNFLFNLLAAASLDGGSKRSRKFGKLHVFSIYYFYHLSNTSTIDINEFEMCTKL